jgi:hypothetical protein
LSAAEHPGGTSSAAAATGGPASHYLPLPTSYITTAGGPDTTRCFSTQASAGHIPPDRDAPPQIHAPGGSCASQR